MASFHIAKEDALGLNDKNVLILTGLLIARINNEGALSDNTI